MSGGRRYNKRRRRRTFTGKFPVYPANIIFWPTSSHTFFGLVSQGSRLQYLQDIVYNIKLLERQFSVTVRPLWMPVTDFQLHLECVALQAAASTDEWSADRPTLQTIFQAAGEWPDVDCFSASFNTICPRFFSHTAHGNSAGVHFFMQNLSTNTVYFYCPPVHLVIACCRRFPLSHAVKSVFKVRAPFFYANAGSSHVFSENPNFDV
jgi:hypothetical protein